MKFSILLMDIALWPIMQLAVAKLFVSMPDRLFATTRTDSLPHPREIWIYKKLLHIRKWKRWLPDGALWVRGSFSKKHLQSLRQPHLTKYVLETKRGEAAHWTAITCCLFFFPWNPLIAWPILLLIAFALNLPCIFVQRYNRIVLSVWLRRGSVP